MYNSQPVRMLYIEDDKIIAFLMQEQLSQQGYIVDIAADGETGLAKLKECQYDIVAVDYHLLPNMNGLQVLQKLQEIGFNIPTIMITGEGNEEVAVAAMKLGVSDYLIKDTEGKYFKRLSSVLRNAIDKRRLIAEKTQAENALQERDAILEAVSFAAEQFLTASHWAQPIQAVLARLGKAANASRSYIFKNHTYLGRGSSPTLLMSQCYEWVADGITPQIDNPDLQNLPYSPLFGRWARTLRQGQAIQGLVKDFPDEEILVLTAQHIISIVILPIFVGKNWWGFMGYDYCSEERTWSPVVLDALKTTARILGAAIQQEQMGLALWKSEQQVQTFIDTAEDLIYFRTLAGVPTPLNAAYTTITGYSCEEFKDKWQAITHPEDLKTLNTFFVSHPQGTSSFETEYRLRTKEGQWRWVHSRMVGSKDQNDSYIGYHCIGRDITNRKWAEEALQKSQTRLAQAQRLAHLGSWERHLVTKTLQWSEETFRIFGLPPDDNSFPQETFFQALHPEDVESVQQAIAQTLYHYQPYQIEFRIIRPDGKVRYVISLAEVTRNAEDQPVSMFGAIQDITERKQAEQALRESEQTLRAVMDATTDTIFMMELDGTCVLINPTGAARFNLNVSDMIGKGIYDFMPPEVATQRKAMVEEVIRTKKSTLVVDERAGLWLEGNICPVFDNNGKVTRIAVFARDITKRKRAEVALRKERDFTTAILDTAGCLIVVLNRVGQIVRFNHTCEKLTGYTFAEVNNHYVWDFLLPPENIEPVKNYFGGLITTHPPKKHYENCWLTKYQTPRLIAWSNTTLLDDDGKVEYVIATGLDITERKQAEEALKKVLAEQAAILDNSMVGIAFLGPRRLFRRVNKKFEALFGYSEAELKGRTTEILYPSHELFEQVGNETYPPLEQGLTYQGEHLMRHQNGTLFWCRFLVKAIDQEDLSRGYIWNLEDVTEQRQAQEKLRLAATVFETTTEAILITDANNRIITVNPAFTTITGYPLEEVIGKQPNILKSDKHDAAFYAALWNSLIQKGKWQGEIWNCCKSGELYAEWLSIVAIKDSNNQIIQYVAVFSDITKRKQAEELIWRQANYDALTNLPNRSLFTNRLALAISTAKRSQERVALLFIDLDRFKWVNDTLGHQAGDVLLQEAAQRLTHCVREADTVARLGGDEFTVVLPNLEEVLEARKIAERILDSLSQPFTLDNHEVSIGGSIGITCFPDDGQEVETLLKNADTAMYQAKENGRNTFRFFTAAMNFQVSEHLRLENALHRALERSQFVLHYQPIINLASGQLIGAESLLCWQPPQQELVLPNRFMSLAEDTGLIVPMGRWGLRAVAQQLQDWHDIGWTFLQLTINVSPRQLRSAQFLELVTTVLNRTKLPPHSLIFEVTENILLETLPEIITTLCQLGELGVQIAIEDFGTGGVFFHYLKQIPIQFLKIGPTFIQDVTSNNYNMILLETIITLAHKLNLKVIGEGVETREQLEFLRSQGCDLVQGYYFSKPLSCENFEQFAKSKS